MTRRVMVDHLLTGIAVMSAFAVAGVMVRREFFARPAAAAGARPPLADTVRLKSWARYAEGGHRIGAITPKVTIVEFTDFQCPYCRRFYIGSLLPILAKYPNDVAIVIQHYPLPMHSLAYSAARALECASHQGRFAEFHDILWQKQDSFAQLSFILLAARAGIVDTQAFGRCNGHSEPVPEVEHGLALAKELSAHGTPLVLVNGLQFTGAIDENELDRLVRDAISGH